jgi:hypothetical protein
MSTSEVAEVGYVPLKSEGLRLVINGLDLVLESRTRIHDAITDNSQDQLLGSPIFCFASNGTVKRAGL